MGMGDQHSPVVDLQGQRRLTQRRRHGRLDLTHGQPRPGSRWIPASTAGRLHRAASRPNAAASDGVWAELEVVCYGLQARRQALYARSELERFIRDVVRFNTDWTGEMLLYTARPDLSGLPTAFPLWRDAQRQGEASPDLPRYIALALADCTKQNITGAVDMPSSSLSGS